MPYLGNFVRPRVALDGTKSGFMTISNRNVIINGAMQVAQRSTSVAAIGATNGVFTADRFKHYFGDASAGRLTQSQASITDLAGFANALKLDCTTADTSIASGEVLTIGQDFEGQDLQRFKKGHATAESFTLSFYVKGTAKTYAVELLDLDNTRHVTATFNVTTSWNRIELTFPADTTGKFDDDNANSMHLMIWLHAGTDYTSGSAATAWASKTNANRAVGCQSFFDSTSNELYITGVQFEVGTVATPYEHKSYGEELARCQRYYEVFDGGLDVLTGAAETSMFMPGRVLSSNRADAQFPLKVSKRATPSASISNFYNWIVKDSAGGSTTLDGNQTYAVVQTTSNIAGLRTTGGGTLSNLNVAVIQIIANIAFDAEL